MADLVKGRRCSGQCCARFYLPYGPEELRERVQNPARYFTRGIEDGEQILGMVIHLGADDLDANKRPRKRGTANWYTCKNYDPKRKGGCCTIYDTRPRMCRDFPEYGDPERACEYDGCASHPLPRRWPLTRPLWYAVVKLGEIGDRLREANIWALRDDGSFGLFDGEIAVKRSKEEV